MRRNSIAGALSAVLLIVGMSGCSSVGLDADEASKASQDSVTTSPTGFVGHVDVGGRRLYLECSGSGAPTVVLISGLRSSGHEWHTSESTSEPPAGPVFDEVATTNRVCSYDRPGTVSGDRIGRSDPAPQPTSAAASASDLHAALTAAGEPGPYIVVGHSIGGTIARVFATANPDDVAGVVLIDSASEFLQDNETPEQWAIQRRLMKVDASEIADSVAEYPDIETFDIDATFEQLRSGTLPPVPLVVLSADAGLGPAFPEMIATGALPPDTPLGFGVTFDAAQSKAQAQLAALVPGATHITETHSGHDIHLVQPQLVIDAIHLSAAANGGFGRPSPEAPSADR